MTKQIIKLKTMTQLMALPTCLPLQKVGMSILHQNLLTDFLFKVIESISHSEELNKPVRRSEKQILNAMLKSCTFPIKTRVQDPWHKSYTLLITAVDRVPIADFSLRVEQSEVVERTIRILSALIDLAKFRLTGPILVNAILIEKALRTRLWSLIERAVEEADQPIKSAFLLQCGGLLDKTIENIKTIDAVNLNNFNSIVHGIPIQQVIPLQDGAIIQTFMNGFKITQLTFAFMVIEEGLIVTIDHVFPSTTPAQLPFIPIYNLICYDVRTNTTLLHRKFEYTQATPIQFQCKVPQGTTRHNIKVNFLSSIAGQDLYYSPNREIQLDDDRNRKKTRIRRKQTPKPNQNTASNINFDDFTCVDTIPPDTNEETNQHFEKLMDDEIKDVDAPKSTRVPYQSTMDEYYYQELIDNQNNNTKPISTTVVEACSQAQSIVDTAHRSEASELISRKRCNDVTIKIPVRAEAARLLNKARSPPMPDNVLQTLHEKAKELKLAQVNVRRIQPKKYTSIGRGNRLHDESDSLQPDFKIGKVDRSHEAIDLARKRKYEDELRMPNNQPSYGALERNGVVYRKQESNDRISTLEEDPYGKVNQLHTFHPAENFQQHSSSFFDDNIISQGSGSTSRLKCYRKRLNKQESDREYTTLVTPVKVESHSFSNSSHRAVSLKDCQQEQSFWSLVQNPNPSSQICKTANATSGNDQPLKDRPIQKISFDDCFY